MLRSSKRKVLTESPYEKAFLERFHRCIKGKGIVGSVLVTCIDEEDEFTESEDESIGRIVEVPLFGTDDFTLTTSSSDSSEVKEHYVHTNEQVDSLRYVLLTENRKKACNSTSLSPCGPTCITASRTLHADDAVRTILKETANALNQKTLPMKFDSLFALTFAMEQNLFWLEDCTLKGAGGEVDFALGGLATAWRNLLSKTDAQLGIDTEFTRPGVETVLDRLKTTVEADCDGKYCFEWSSAVVEK